MPSLRQRLEHGLRAIVRRENGERREALATYERLSQGEAAATLREEIAVLEPFEGDAA